MDEKENRDKERTSEEYRQEAEEHIESLKQGWKVFGGTGIFVIAALVTLILITIAWYTNNTQVGVGGINIGAKSDDYEVITKLSTADVSDRDKNFLTETRNLLSYVVVGDEEYSVSEDILSVKTSGAKNEVNWLLGGDDNFDSIEPGAAGVLTFYIVPKKSGTNIFHCEITLAGYTDGTNSGSYVSADSDAQELLTGHMLFFEDAYYTNQIEVTEGKMELSVSFDVEEGHESDEHEVKIYWVWPQIFGQFLLQDGSAHLKDFNYKALFPLNVRNRLKEEMLAYPEYFFYGTETISMEIDGITSEVIRGRPLRDAEKESIRNAVPGMLSSSYSVSAYSELCQYYNRADEHIGSNVKYIMISLDVLRSN